MAKLAMVHEKLDRGDATKDYGVDLPYPQLMNINGSTKTLAMVSMMFMETTLELKLKAGMNQLAHQLLVSSQCTQVRGKLSCFVRYGFEVVVLVLAQNMAPASK